jgi:hypothetical protein
MTSTRPPTSPRQPLLSIEEFGNLVSSAFENQNIRLSFDDSTDQNTDSLPATTPVSPTESTFDLAQPSAQQNPPRLRGVRSFRWLGSRSNTTSTPVSPTMEADQPFFENEESLADRRRGWVTKMPVLGTLKTKKSLERVAARKMKAQTTRSLPPPDSPTMTRPAPFFYAQSHFSTDSIPAAPHESPSGDSIDSVEIRSWKQRTLPKVGTLYMHVTTR